MSGPAVSASLVGDTEGVTVSLTVLQDEAGKVWPLFWEGWGLDWIQTSQGAWRGGILWAPCLCSL